MRFVSREEAGCELAEWLQAAGITAGLVLGLPRGGVIVAVPVARELGLPLDVLIVRKLGHPQHREFAVGALAEPDVVILDEESIDRNLVTRAQLDEVITEEIERLRRYRVRFHLRRVPELAGKQVLLVDDGLATGATMEAAVHDAGARGAGRIVVAAPVASSNVAQRLEAVADVVKVACVDPEFDAVGRYYQSFEQTTDEEVIACLCRQPQ